MILLKNERENKHEDDISTTCKIKEDYPRLSNKEKNTGRQESLKKQKKEGQKKACSLGKLE